jgi:hypothetical protein
MSSERLIGTLRLAGAWLIALMCLTLTLQTAWLATPSGEGAAKPFEWITQNLGTVLLDSPVEPTGNVEHLKQQPETEAVSPSVVLPDQESQYGSGFLHITNTPRWVVRSFPLSLPRPPPLS